MTTPARRVVLTGAECTGKTTLAQRLAERFDAPWSPEYARRFVAGLDRDLTLEDVPAIGTGQVAGEDEAIARAGALVLHDTDLLSTVVYSRHYFGAVPPGIEPLAWTRVGDLYLLHHPDVPWRPEAGQRGSLHDRNVLHGLFAAMLEKVGARVIPIQGSWDEREAAAVDAVERLLVV